MAREWQQTKLIGYTMPDTVYYQSIWAVRDLERMEKRVNELTEVNVKGGSLVSDGKTDYAKKKPTEKTALERLVLEERIRGIKNALALVPETYRPIVVDNITIKTKPEGQADKMWRIWKQRFLYHVAVNLSIM